MSENDVKLPQASLFTELEEKSLFEEEAPTAEPVKPAEPAEKPKTIWQNPRASGLLKKMFSLETLSQDEVQTLAESNHEKMQNEKSGQ